MVFIATFTWYTSKSHTTRSKKSNKAIFTCNLCFLKSYHVQCSTPNTMSTPRNHCATSVQLTPCRKLEQSTVTSRVGPVLEDEAIARWVLVQRPSRYDGGTHSSNSLLDPLIQPSESGPCGNMTISAEDSGE